MPPAGSLDLGWLRLFVHGSAWERAYPVEKLEDVPVGSEGRDTDKDRPNVEKTNKSGRRIPNFKSCFLYQFYLFRK